MQWKLSEWLTEPGQNLETFPEQIWRDMDENIKVQIPTALNKVYHAFHTFSYNKETVVAKDSLPLGIQSNTNLGSSMKEFCRCK